MVRRGPLTPGQSRAIEQALYAERHVLRSYVAARGLDVVDEYIDHGVSGSRDRRPALDEMMEKAKRRSFNAIAVGSWTAWPDPLDTSRSSPVNSRPFAQETLTAGNAGGRMPRSPAGDGRAPCHYSTLS